MSADDQYYKVLDGHPSVVAKRLLGCYLVRQLPEGEATVRIVEAEAYHQDDAASHSYRGETDRTKVMFGPSGHLYVYFTYGMHYCANVVTSGRGVGAGVLIRAVEPVEGIEIMSKYRTVRSHRMISNGPAKLCQALDIDFAMSGHDLRASPLRLLLNKPLHSSQIATTTRIGISKDAHRQWRFYDKASEYVSVY